MAKIDIKASELIRALKYALPYGTTSPLFLMVKMKWTFDVAKGVSEYINFNFEKLLEKYKLQLEL